MGKKTAENFKSGWDAAAAEVASSPLAEELMNLYPQVHPDRIVDFIDAFVAKKNPDPEDFKEAKVIAFPAAISPFPAV